MRSIQFTVCCVAVACILLGCSKDSDDGGDDCQDANTTKVIYTNTGTVPLRIQVAASLTPQFVPVNPILSLDLAPGATVTKEFQADRYFNVWYRDCGTTCSMVSYNSKTYATCSSYEEKLGL